jgi:hypothetical protein
MNKSRLRVFLKDPLLKGVENCSVWAEITKNVEGAMNRTLLSKQTSIQTGAGRQSQEWQMQSGNWCSLTYFLWVWGIGHNKS